MRRLVTLAALGVVGAAIVVSGAFAQTQALKKQGTKDLNGQFGAIGGSDMQPGGDSLAYQVRVYPDGSIGTRSLDNPEWRDQVQNLIFAPLGANGGVVMQQYPVPIRGAKLLTLILQCQMAAAADSDSVNIAVYAVTKRTDQLADGVSFAWDADQTDAFMTPLYFTRNQQPQPNGATSSVAGFKFTRRVYGTSAVTGHPSLANPVCFTAPLVDDSGAPLMGDFILLRAVNMNVNRAIQFLTIDASIHYE